MEALAQLYTKFGNSGFNIIGCFSNEFAGQAGGDDEKIEHDACTLFKAVFPVTKKILVNGDNVHPLWKYLKKEKPGFLGTEGIKWNFTQFLCDSNGKPVERFSPGVDFDDVQKALVPLLPPGWKAPEPAAASK